ncbi:MAG: DNA-directed RNA polymerase [Promethearchaeota archaeon]
MYKLIKIQDTVRVDPSRFGDPLEDVVLEICRDSYEGIINSDLGLTIAVTDVIDIGIGKLIPGDGAAYYDVIFNILSYKPEDHEIVEGEVVEATDFGLFVRLGCIDALIHVSQVYDDFFSYDGKHALQGRESNKIIRVGDQIRARVIAISLTKNAIRMGLSMRQPGLGAKTWIEGWIKEVEEGTEGKETAEAEKSKPKKKRKKRRS